MLELLPLIVGVLLAQLTPGPNMMSVSSTALNSGRRAGVLTAAGVATGVFIWAILFAIGIGAIIAAFPQTITAMKLLGGSYLLFVGARAILAARRGQTTVPVGAAASGRAFRLGLLVVLTNPKAALMWVAVSVFLASAGLTGPQFVLAGACIAVSALAIYGTYAWLFSTGAAVRAYGRVARLAEATFGALFGVLGAKLVTDGLREMRA